MILAVKRTGPTILQSKISFDTVWTVSLCFPYSGPILMYVVDETTCSDMRVIYELTSPVKHDACISVKILLVPANSYFFQETMNVAPNKRYLGPRNINGHLFTNHICFIGER